ncbi:MAG: protein kinase [Kofleriaceae bacterium]|nr:protein kinase [Kofleriaceae bacterium]
MSFVCPACGQRYAQGGFCSSDGTQLATTTDPMLGAEVGRYRLARLLGEGGMGAVYLGVQPRIGSRVAIKVLSAECTRNADLYQRFLSEARAVNVIKHEHIVGVVDMAELPDGRPYIVMEFIEGKTLGALVRSGQAPLGGIVQVVTELLAALEAAHTLGIVHRDLKPDNVLVTAQGHAKVLDFGIAKLAPGLGATSSPRTKTGALLGTPAYMAPEQISGAGNVDPRTDVYAAGIVLFEAVTGKPPFISDTLFELMRMHLEQVPPSPRLARPDLPLAFEQVILTALAKDPNARFQSAAAMSAALRHAAQQLPADQWQSLSTQRPLAGQVARTPVEPIASRVQAAPSTVRSGPPSVAAATLSTRGKLWLWAMLGVFLVAGGVGIGVMASRGDSSLPSETAASASSEPAPPPQAPAAEEPATKTTDSPATAFAASATRTPPKPAQAPLAPPKPSSPPASTSTPATVTDDVRDRAAAAGVKIGNNVSLGPNVVIGGGAPTSPSGAPSKPQRFTRPIDYNPKKFDATAYAPKALALARSVFPDAGFVRMDIMGVFPSGLADLGITDDDSTYWFRSPANSGRPTSIPKNQEIDIYCYVEVTVGTKGVEVRVRDMSMDAQCKWPLRPLPRCSLAKVWNLGKSKGADPETFAKIAFLADGEWFFDNDTESYDGVTESFADSCP